MSGISVVMFAMGEPGHFKRLRPLIGALTAAGVTTHVFTDSCFRDEVERLGGRFADLFAGRPIAKADATSIPIPCRFVSFAGHYGDDVVREVAVLKPDLVVHDTFAVIGVVVANRLGAPRVNVCAGHNLAPEPTVEALRRDPRVNVSAECWSGVRLLQERHGMPDASPFSYVTALSTRLNLYCEPAEFLPPENRAPFQPIEFFGSLAPEDVDAEPSRARVFGDDDSRLVRIYASFGTVIWRYYEAAALAALDALSQALSDRDDAAAVVSLGGVGPSVRAARLARRNVRIEPYVDQPRVLQQASVFLTHQGLNSTHEAIFHGVPMISYPFFMDQPDLARRCQELGLAVPLSDTPRAPVDADDIRGALAVVASRRGEMRTKLAEARRWEWRTIHGRSSVVERLLTLVR